MRTITLPWQDPISVANAAQLHSAPLVFLHSSLQTHYSGRTSILAWDIKNQIQSSDFTEFHRSLSSGKKSYENAWFGYLGYGLKDALETLPEDKAPVYPLPHLWMAQFHNILVWEHTTKTLILYTDHATQPHWNAVKAEPKPAPLIQKLQTNIPRDTYQQYVSQILTSIEAGDLYQANLTRKIYGEFADAPDAFSIFIHLSQRSPAPYSAYIQTVAATIISSSPEQFLSVTDSGLITARPIKGSAARHTDPAKDAAAKEALLHSEKDRAENLMIVDLMRNDLSRCAEAGSVKVDELYHVESFATIHHMMSTITAQRRPDVTTLDVVKQAFPPGSMTGAPKIQAMRMLSALEQDARGIYSGAIGWFGGDGSADLSVVIRTLILQDKRFEFQVGGGIVADSKPEAEWRESLAKAAAIADTLGISREALEAL